jgi:hypothetical protein
MHASLFDGVFPLKREVVEAETNKRSLGATAKAADVLQWSAKIDVLKAIAIESQQIAEKALNLKN